MKNVGWAGVAILLLAIVGPSALRCNTSQGASQDTQAAGRGNESTRHPTEGRHYHAILAIAERHGSTTPASTTSVRFSSDQTDGIAAYKDRDATDVLTDGQSVELASRYQFDDVQSDHTIDVLFDRHRSHK